ncbi:MAG: hypothetical protein V8R51_04930 [Clostridia bacterium]
MIVKNRRIIVGVIVIVAGLVIVLLFMNFKVVISLLILITLKINLKQRIISNQIKIFKRKMMKRHQI